MDVEHDSPIPLYEQIRDYFRAQIESGHLAGNTRLPSERQLAEQFHVSRLTVTKALKELEREGLVYSRVGKGTFVAPPSKIAQKLEMLSSFTQDMTAQNKQVTSRVLAACVENAENAVATGLQIAPGTAIFVLERLRLADQLIIALERSHIPYTLCPQIDQQHDFERESLYQVLREEYGILLTCAQQTIEARAATTYEVGALGIAPNIPVLAFTRITFNEANQPVEFVRAVYRSDRYKLHIELKPSGSSQFQQRV
jgi:GntR family transcriptional regulator